MFPPEAHPGKEPPASALAVVQLLVLAILVSALFYLMLDSLLNSALPMEVLTQTPAEVTPANGLDSEARLFYMENPALRMPNNEGW